MALGTIALELGPQKHQKTGHEGGQGGGHEDREKHEMPEVHVVSLFI